MGWGQPKISIAIPVFNGAAYIESCIDSILDQTFTDFELLVVDNASTDDTVARVSAYVERDSRVRLIRNPKNVGAAENYNIGFRNTHGEFVKWSACDDRISPNFLQDCLEVLEADRGIALAFGNTQGIDENGDIVPYVGHHAPSIESDDPAVRFERALTQSGTCFPIFGLFRRSQLEKTMLHRPYYGSDRALLAEVALFGDFKLVEKAVFYNREHQERSINIDDKLQRSFWQNGQKSRRASAEHINLALHLFQIARAHPGLASWTRLMPILLARSLRLVELRRYALELSAMMAPRLTSTARRLFVKQFGQPSGG